MRRISWSLLLALAACFSEPGDPGVTAATTGSEGSGSTCAPGGTCGEPSTSTQPTGITTTSGVEATTEPPDQTESGPATSTFGTSESSVGPQDTSGGSMSTNDGTATTDSGTCPDTMCAECVLCSFEMDCVMAHLDCAGDMGACAAALSCLDDCLMQKDVELQACVGACGCADGDDLLLALIQCAADVCEANGACPQLPCI